MINDEASTAIYHADVIEHAGQFWLVPEWLDNPNQRVTMPRRIVSLATIPHQRTEGANPEFVVNDPIPRFVFDGQIPPAQGHSYVVIDLPEIRFPILRRTH